MTIRELENQIGKLKAEYGTKEISDSEILIDSGEGTLRDIEFIEYDETENVIIIETN